MPRHIHYCEPYAGGASVLLQRDPNDESLWYPGHKGVSEVLNDVDRELMNFWSVLRHKEWFVEFQRLVSLTPLARSSFENAHYEFSNADSPTKAYNFFIRARQSRAGTFKGFTQLTRNRLRRGVNGNASEWLGAVEGLPQVHARLQPVVLECMDALKLIAREDGPATLMYLDPPYVHEARTAKKVFKNEMTDRQHMELLCVIHECTGKVMLSGYHSTLYDSSLSKWTCHEFDLPNHAAGGKEKRRMTEVIWCNF
jgi:DNA adenine methylase